MTIMFCSFAGKPWILRLYGKGEVVQLDSDRGRELHPLFGSIPGERHQPRNMRTGEDGQDHGMAGGRIRAAPCPERM